MKIESICFKFSSFDTINQGRTKDGLRAVQQSITKILKQLLKYKNCLGLGSSR